MKTSLKTGALSLLAVASTGATFAAAKSNPKKEAKRPNIIFILSDDGGYADFGFQGSKQFETPNLDAMAKKGVIFEQIYTTDAVSGPSRAGLMTGRYQQRFGIEENGISRKLMSDSSKFLDDDMGVPTTEKFVSNYLSDAGYKCAIFGKWHLGGADRFHPLNRGYDHFIGFRSGSRSYYAYPDEKIHDETFDHTQKLEYGMGTFKEPEVYMTDLLADEACNYVKENKKNPFFIYLSFNAVHSPLQIDKQDAALFKNIKDPSRRKLAAMAFSMDRALGRLFETLKKEGVDKNTIIVFSNDNGGPNGTHTSNYPLSGMKGTFLEGGVRVPGFMVYPGVIKPDIRYEYPVSFLDFLPTFADVAGAEIKEDADLDGVNIIPYINGENKERPHQTLYWHCDTRGALRDGDWKFMRFADRPAELYDISKDEGEQNDLADKHPELVKKYYKMLFDWEMTLERPMWMLDRFCEKRVMNTFYEQEEYRHPVEQK
ncbi:MAG: sulfatase-like hydrolase/transferase [Rikenellaceae bacterium]